MLLKLLPAQSDHICTVTCSAHPAADHNLSALVLMGFCFAECSNIPAKFQDVYAQRYVV